MYINYFTPVITTIVITNAVVVANIKDRIPALRAVVFLALR